MLQSDGAVLPLILVLLACSADVLLQGHTLASTLLLRVHFCTGMWVCVRPTCGMSVCDTVASRKFELQTHEASLSLTVSLHAY